MLTDGLHTNYNHIHFIRSCFTPNINNLKGLIKQSNSLLKRLQKVPALRAFWDLEKTVLHEIRVSGTVLWSPTNANSPTYTYISQKSC